MDRCEFCPFTHEHHFSREALRDFLAMKAMTVYIAREGFPQHESDEKYLGYKSYQFADRILTKRDEKKEGQQ